MERSQGQLERNIAEVGAMTHQEQERVCLALLAPSTSREKNKVAPSCTLC